MTLAGCPCRIGLSKMVVTESFGRILFLFMAVEGMIVGIIAGALSALILRVRYSPRTLVVDAVLGIVSIFLTAVFALVRFRLWGDGDSFLVAAVLVSASLPVVLHAMQRLLRPR
jgi:hypothetical protein